MDAAHDPSYPCDWMGKGKNKRAYNQSGDFRYWNLHHNYFFYLS